MNRILVIIFTLITFTLTSRNVKSVSLCYELHVPLTSPEYTSARKYVTHTYFMDICFNLFNYLSVFHIKDRKGGAQL